VIKLCIAAFLDAYERRGAVALPLNWMEVLDALDGRRVRINQPDSSSVSGIPSAQSPAAMLQSLIRTKVDSLVVEQEKAAPTTGAASDQAAPAVPYSESQPSKRSRGRSKVAGGNAA